MKRKTKSVQIKAFALLMIFVINMTVLCSCGLAQMNAHRHTKMMMKNCCCCKHNSSKKDCKDNHTISFNQSDKTVAQSLNVNPIFAVAFISAFYHVSFNTVIKNITVKKSISFIDTSPPDLQVLYQSFLI